MAVVATGGTESTIDVGGTDYRLHIFSSSGTFTVTEGGDIEYLVVGAGGGGSSGGFGVGSGGGGAGGMRTGTTTITAAAHAITVDAGGSAGINPDLGTAGGASSIGALIESLGGGAGGRLTVAATGGGSGGGAGARASEAAPSAQGTGGAGTGGQGNDGGDRVGLDGAGGGAGGGGASVAGGNTTATPVGAVGGDGTASSITGSSVTYAGGGGGGGGTGGGNGPGAGGLGGGGSGGTASASSGVAGTANTGGGGGGGAGSSGNGGAGGSGIVIIRYPLAPEEGVMGGLGREFNGGGRIRWALPGSNPIESGLTSLRFSFWTQLVTSDDGKTILAMHNGASNTGVYVRQIVHSGSPVLLIEVRLSGTVIASHRVAQIAEGSTARVHDWPTQETRLHAWRQVAVQIGIDPAAGVRINTLQNGLSGTNVVTDATKRSTIPVTIGEIVFGAELSDGTDSVLCEVSDFCVGVGQWGNTFATMELPSDAYSIIEGLERWGMSLRSSYGSDLAFSDDWLNSNGTVQSGVTPTTTGNAYRMIGAPVGGRYPDDESLVWIIGDTQRYSATIFEAGGFAYQTVGRRICAYGNAHNAHIWHVGDIIDWQSTPSDRINARARARAFMRVMRANLDASLQYLKSIGNHEFQNAGYATDSIRQMTDVISPTIDDGDEPILQRGADLISQPGFRSAFSGEIDPTNDPDNSASWTAHYTVELGGQTWNVFVMPCDSWGEIVSWVINRMNAAPFVNYPTAIMTHATVDTVGVTDGAAMFGILPAVVDSWDNIFARFAAETTNLRLVTSGHYHQVVIEDVLTNIWLLPIFDVEYNNGIDVPHIATNAQSQTNNGFPAGDGLCRLLRFSGDDVRVETFLMATGYEVYDGGGHGFTIPAFATVGAEYTLDEVPITAIGNGDQPRNRFRGRWRF